MKPSQLSAALELNLSIAQPTFIWGSPGGGKSSIVSQLAARLKWAIIDERAVLKDPVDLRGLPHVNGDQFAHWCIPDDLPREDRDGKYGILFLDELNRAPELVQNAYLQLVLDRKIGQYRLPDNWQIIAAGNDDDMGTRKLNAALRSRFQHLDLTTDLDELCKYAIQSNWEPMTIAFLRSFPHLVHSFDKNSRTFPCPRTWEFISKLSSKNPSPDIALDMFKGCVGEGTGVEYFGYTQLYATLPNLDAIRINPKTERLPDTPSAQYAVSAAIARRMTDKTIGSYLLYLERMPVEYAVCSIRDAITRDNSLTSTKDFTRWSIAHSEVIF